MIRSIGLLSILFLFMSLERGVAGPTRVGNGDDGGDLEAVTSVTTGILIETRDEAVASLRRLDVARIEGLGTLIPEVAKSEIQLVGRDVDLSQILASPEGKQQLVEEAKSIGALGEKNQLVYARTFPEPHAATRFFPAALRLDRKQLVALHIHEGLHRALPKDLREDESAVSRITLALTSQDVSVDRVKAAMARELGSLGSRAKAVPHDRVANTLEYSYRSYFQPEPEKSLSSISSLHSLKSFFLPFESDNIGVGVEMTFVIRPERYFLGPLGFSGRWTVADVGRTNIDLFGTFHLNTLSDSEIKDTPLGRDTVTVGVSFRRDEPIFKFENKIFLTPASESRQATSAGDVTYKYGSIFGARISAAAKIRLSETSSLEWGGLGEVLLSNPLEIHGGANPRQTGRLRVVSLGPEIGYRAGDFKYSVYGRFILDSTDGVSLDQVGDLMGFGAGQGSVGGALSWQF